MTRPPSRRLRASRDASRHAKVCGRIPSALPAMPRQPSPSCHGLVSPPFSGLGYYKGSRQRIQAPVSAAALPSEDARERGRRSRRACRHLTPLAVRNPGWIFLGNVQPVCWTQEDARQCVAMQAAIPPRPLPAYPGTIGRETSHFLERFCSRYGPLDFATVISHDPGHTQEGGQPARPTVRAVPGVVVTGPTVV